MMVLELIVGYWTKSLALTADGWHMATHVGALGLSAVAYWYARTRAGESRFAFGTGKVYALAGFTSSILLLLVSFEMVTSGVVRLVKPEPVDFADALPVAIMGLLVNLLSAVLLGTSHDDRHHGGHSHNDPRHFHEAHAHEGHSHEGHSHEGHSHAAHHHPALGDANLRNGGEAQRSAKGGPVEGLTGSAAVSVSESSEALRRAADEHGHDHNLRAAYLHVVADALTSLLAILALVAGRYFSLSWLDAVVAIVAAFVILKWATGLVVDCARQLIDLGPSTVLQDRVRRALEELGQTRVLDLHLWLVGPKRLVCVVSVTSRGDVSLDDYKRAIRRVVAVDHLTVEIVPA
jgi:cation diffusion facilitator family transporter